MKARRASPTCRCREPKRDAHCSYCGSLYAGDYICGVCREAGIDGKLIPGTGRVTCAEHKPCEYCGRPGTATNPTALTLISPPVDGHRVVRERMHKRCATRCAAAHTH